MPKKACHHTVHVFFNRLWHFSEFAFDPTANTLHKCPTMLVRSELELLEPGIQQGSNPKKNRQTFLTQPLQSQAKKAKAPELRILGSELRSTNSAPWPGPFFHTNSCSHGLLVVGSARITDSLQSSFETEWLWSNCFVVQIPCST